MSDSKYGQGPTWSKSFDDVQIKSGSDDSPIQSAQGSSSPRNLSFNYPRQFSVYMADDDDENTDVNCSNK